MFNLIKLQCKIMFQQIGVKITFYFILCMVIINYIINLQVYKNVDRSSVPFFTEYSLLSGNNMSGWYVVIFIWFLLVFPGSMSYAIDKKLNIDSYIITRSKGQIRYITSKLISNFITTFCAIAFPLVIELLLYLCAFSVESSKKMIAISDIFKQTTGFENKLSPNTFLIDYYQFNPFMYAFIRIVLLALLASLMSFIPMAFSCICNKYLSFLMIPVYFLLNIFYNMKFGVFGHKISHKYDDYVRWDSDSLTKEYYTWFLILNGMIAILAIGFIYFYERKKEV